MATFFTHTHGITYKNDAGTITSTTNTYTGNAEINYEAVIPVSTTNQAVTIDFTRAHIVSFVLYASNPVTIKTNSTTTPGNTIALAAKQQIVWATDHVEADPFTVDVTEIFITNASATLTAQVEIRVLLAL